LPRSRGCGDDVLLNTRAVHGPADEELHGVGEEHSHREKEATEGHHCIVCWEVVEHVGLGIHLELGIPPKKYMSWGLPRSGAHPAMESVMHRTRAVPMEVWVTMFHRFWVGFFKDWNTRKELWWHT
jgi:hypothetical protein